MSPAVYNLYIDFFNGRLLENDIEGIDSEGNPEYGISSRVSFPGVAIVYILRSK